MSTIEDSGNRFGLWNGVRTRTRVSINRNNSNDGHQVTKRTEATKVEANAGFSSRHDRNSTAGYGPLMHRPTEQAIVGLAGSSTRNFPGVSLRLLTPDDSVNTHHAGDNSNSFEKQVTEDQSGSFHSSNLSLYSSTFTSDLQISSLSSEDQISARNQLTQLPQTRSRASAHSARFTLNTDSGPLINDSQVNVQPNTLHSNASSWYPRSEKVQTRLRGAVRPHNNFKSANTHFSSEDRPSMVCESQDSTIEIPSSWSVDKMEEHTAHSTVTTERKNVDDDSTIESNAHSPRLMPQVGLPEQPPHLHSALGTPSTVSTTPSTDFEVHTGIEAASTPSLERGSNANVESSRFNHRRVPSWDNSLPPASGAWSNTPRVASFRDEHRLAHPPLAHPQLPPTTPESRWQNRQPRFSSPEVPYLPSGRQSNAGGYHQRQGHNSPYSTYSGVQRQPSGSYLSHATTHPRSATASQRNHGPRSPRLSSTVTGGGSGTGGSRSASEVLKTLLRKKACLYEPDTSRAVALATWLVGRELGLEYGFFSRQQLQAGVHTCVASKIDGGLITRTKVNRCMQIILNSCFHYIIPRPDGTEEKGDSFAKIFASEVSDDVALLRMLPTPWNDLTLDRDSIVRGAAEEPKGQTPKSTPHSSPRLGSSTPASPVSDHADGDHKRAVLLCFNENVRCAEDVFRCHNEFIKDTAHASSLQLSSQEWRIFFGPQASGSPYIWDYVGIPLPHGDQRGALNPDALGVMTPKECDKFRTSWCSKRYDHDHETCGFAHVEVNQGWLRRDPSKYVYKNAMCPHVITLEDENQRSFTVNTCPYGTRCDHAHSWEEIGYHPLTYKTKLCPAVSRGCNVGDVCPHHHPADQYRFRKGENSKPSQRRNHHQPGKTTPQSSPVVYSDPAPLSEFERQLQLAGLKSLYRRQCAVVCSHMKHEPCYYRPFSDTGGLGKVDCKHVGLPPAPSKRSQS